MPAGPGRRALALTTAAAALLLTAACAAQDTRATTDGCAPSANAATGHPVTDDPAAVASYWTGEREHSAQPAPMPGKGRADASCASPHS
ncbi:hypothetical protein ACFWJ4_28060 [Kitasatospora sp. NPDC127067]|uniref:hypothetical protein n=1 Tax=Kitasatospora sp. NPDC127067 TaxID=3347126 RepID=UPI003660CE0E